MNITEFAQYAGVSKAAVSRYFNGGYLSADKRARIEALWKPPATTPAYRPRCCAPAAPGRWGSSCPSCPATAAPASWRASAACWKNPATSCCSSTPPTTRRRNSAPWTPCAATRWTASCSLPPCTPRSTRPCWSGCMCRWWVLGQQFPGCCSVYHDDFGAAQAATAHMLAKGCHAPGYIGVTLLDKAAGQQRRAGFEAAVKDAGLPVRPQRMVVAKFSTASGYEQAARLLGSDPASTACSAPPTPLLWVPCSTAGRQASASRRM